MSELERDHVLRRVVQSLRHLPTPEPDEVRRVVEAAAAQRLMPPADDPASTALTSRRARSRSRMFMVSSGLVAAAAIVGFLVRGQFVRSTSVATAPTAATPAAPMQPAANAGGGAAAEQDVRPIPQQFVFRSSSARRVAVVGDFNGWNAASALMTRESGGDLWSVTISIRPGRHTYGFMVDDSTFTLDQDARVARARDPDLGVEGSVVIVGRP